MKSMPIKLIVGLGNPGPEYEQTRHNAGSWLVHAMIIQHGSKLSADKKFHGHSSKIKFSDSDVHFLLPNTYMNRSGMAVSAMSTFYKIQAEEILIVHDELDLEPGKVRIKLGGGHGGHNGLRDIIAALGTPNFYRLRIGIGHPGDKNLVVDYVLGKPSTLDRHRIDEVIAESIRHMDQIIRGEINTVMNTLHKLT